MAIEVLQDDNSIEHQCHREAAIPFMCGYKCSLTQSTKNNPKQENANTNLKNQRCRHRNR